MARIADKLSPSQIARFLKSTRHVDGVASVLAILADQEELVLEAELEEARADGEWPQTVCDAIEDHAGGQGPGIWRYVVKATNREGRMCGSSWCRMTVHRGRDAEGNEEPHMMDGSVGSFVQQLQASLAEQNKTNIALTKTVVETLRAQGDMVKTLFERQTALEKERAELIAENLDAAAREAVRTPEKGTDDTMVAIGKMIAEAAMDKYGPVVLKQLGIGLQPGEAGVDSGNGVPQPPAPMAPPEASQASPGPNPD